MEFFLKSFLAQILNELRTNKVNAQIQLICIYLCIVFTFYISKNFLFIFIVKVAALMEISLFQKCFKFLS